MTCMGIFEPKSVMKSRWSPPTSGSRQRAQKSRIFGSSSCHSPGREGPREQASVYGVGRGVFEDEAALRHPELLP